jgi:threonine aldolase
LIPVSVVDLRSDTVTRPTAAMRRAMADADVGDDVFGDDPTVNRFEATVAERLGFEAAMLVPTGTMSNLVALLTHGQRGDEYIAAQGAHCYRYEGGGAAALGGLQAQPLPTDADGRMDPAEIEASIKPDDPHFARTRLVCLEDTFGGLVLPWPYVAQVRALCERRGLSLHLDGARLFNAAVASGAAAGARSAPFDTVSVCFSKGLGAPLGSALCGSSAFISAARRWRKVVGGGMRQAGVVAAACLHALDHHVDDLAVDHARAAELARRLDALPGVAVRAHPAQTNMVWLSLTEGDPARLAASLGERGVVIRPGAPIRLVTHRDLPADAVDRTVAGFEAWIEGGRA